MRTSILALACIVIGLLPPAAWFTFRYQQVKVSYSSLHPPLPTALSCLPLRTFKIPAVALVATVKRLERSRVEANLSRCHWAAAKPLSIVSFKLILYVPCPPLHSLPLFAPPSGIV